MDEMTRRKQQRLINDCEVEKLKYTWKNSEWHHVSLKTMENIDIDMLDEKHRNYLEFYNHYKRVKRIASANRNPFNRNPFKVKGWCKIMIMADERMVSQEAYNMVYKNIMSTLISASKV